MHASMSRPGGPRGGTEMRLTPRVLLVLTGVLLLSMMGAGTWRVTPAAAGSFFFSTGNPDFRMATGSRPGGNGFLEIESADDFILKSNTQITAATFTGLLPQDATIGNIKVQIYRVFPKDSVNPPSGVVPTRVNSPSDVEFDDRSTAAGNLSFSTLTSLSNFTAANSVFNGIHPIPNQTTGGEGPVSGREVIFQVKFTTPFTLPADHYFFVPQVEARRGDFFWLSAPKPIVAGTGPFAGDLQEWIRNENLAPDWLRVGTDIVGGATPPTFNATFSLTGVTVPEPSTLMLLCTGFCIAAWRKGALSSRRRKR